MNVIFKLFLKDRRIVKQIGDTVFVAKYVCTWDICHENCSKTLSETNYNVSNNAICFEKKSLENSTLFMKNFEKYFCI